MKLYIFDLDGTLTDTLGAISHFGNYALHCHGLEPIPKERYKQLVGDGMDVLIHRMLQESHNDTPEVFNNVRTTYDRAYSNDFLYDTQVYAGILNTLKVLKDRGDKLAVLSNKPDHVVSKIVDTVFGAGFFNIVQGQVCDIPKKPCPEGAVKIAEKLNVILEQCIFIGDTAVDILTGKHGGMCTVGVLWGFRDENELRCAGADYIIDTPQQLLMI